MQLEQRDTCSRQQKQQLFLEHKTVFGVIASKPSGTTAWIVYVTTMPLPSSSTCSNLFPAHFSQKNMVFSIRCPHTTHFWAKIFFLFAASMNFSKVLL